MIKPLSNHVLILPIEPKKGLLGVVAKESHLKGTVVAFGESVDNIKKGDVVLYERMSTVVGDGDSSYHMVKSVNLVAIID